MSGHRIKSKTLKTGYLWKQGGSYRNWKKRYFVLKDNTLEYYRSEGDPSPKGTIDLTTGRGVRTREQCELEWPDKARPGRSFGLAVESRTYYLYGDDTTAVHLIIECHSLYVKWDWMYTIQQVINKLGRPTEDYSKDSRGNPETKMSKALRGVKMATNVARKLTKEPAGEEVEGSTTLGDDKQTSEIEEIYDDCESLRFTENSNPTREQTGNTESEAMYQNVSLAGNTESEAVYQNVSLAGDTESEAVYQNVSLAGNKAAALVDCGNDQLGSDEEDSEVEEIYGDLDF